MIVINIKGPRGEATTKLAARIATTLQVEGKVVRKYDDATKAPEKIPACDVAIVVTQE